MGSSCNTQECGQIGKSPGVPAWCIHGLLCSFQPRVPSLSENTASHHLATEIHVPKIDSNPVNRDFCLPWSIHAIDRTLCTYIDVMSLSVSMVINQVNFRTEPLNLFLVEQVQRCLIIDPTTYEAEAKNLPKIRLGNGARILLKMNHKVIHCNKSYCIW